MVAIILLLVCLFASSIGAVVGAGGGVIIKPVLDMLGIIPVSSASFCSGCTVLGMSLCSLIRTRNNGVKLRVQITTPLAVGAAIGGLIGKYLFELVRMGMGNENVLGAIQAVCLTILNLLVFLYICNKEKLPTKHVKNIFVAGIIGIALGIISSFLGIGGGPNNVAVLFFFFSMDAKEAAKNSIYTIVFSQIASITSAVATGSVPDFTWFNLIAMICGGIGGALIGAKISDSIDNKGVEKILKVLTLVLVIMNFYNILKYTIL